ncbi:hypothetical protein GTA08_BOTSDO10252 [Neofusicoccum parvum]|uniref:Uncharacterized protein n=1 Tax=Neofusicoccum parvum TaxID=310453 RepID=A0ACB5S436_9PEZI|nr:hypothetical protein GTA08_BOTSDO10252 [Neofusicoccum parvum]
MSPSQITTLSSLGFVVVAADYRLCPHVTLWDGPLADARHVHAWSRTQLPSLLARDVPGATLDPTKTVAVGYSAGALLALHLATLDPAPAAVADFYGAKRLRDPSWHAPLPALARLPPFDPALLRRVFDEPPATSTGASESLEKGGSADDGSSVGSREKRGRGMPRPDLSKPRNAWLFDGLKRGVHMRAIVPDGDFERCDACADEAYGRGWPPTVFVHGTGDEMVPARISEEAGALLRERGGEVEVIMAEGLPHGFDIGLEVGDEAFEKYVRPALEFLAKRA